MGLYRDDGKENGNYYNRVNIGIHWGYIGMMERKMETTIIGYILGTKLGPNCRKVLHVVLEAFESSHAAQEILNRKLSRAGTQARLESD